MHLDLGMYVVNISIIIHVYRIGDINTLCLAGFVEEETSHEV